MVPRNLDLLVAAVALLVACSPPTEPGTDPDIDKYPYQLSANRVRIFGTSRLLVILAPYADGMPEPYTQAQMQSRLFGGSSGGPIATTFRLASGGTFTLKGDVTPWLRSNLTVAQTQGPGTLTPSGEQDYVALAIQAADQQVNYGLYDNDGPDGKPNSGDDDGLVDGGIVVMHSDFDRFCNGGTGRGPHPYALSRWRVNNQPWPTADARSGGGQISVGGYTLMSATGCSTTQSPAPTVSHELGHLLFGLPDLYQPFGPFFPTPWETRRWVLGCWDLMAAGSGWGCGSGVPGYNGKTGALSAYTRILIGWATPEVVPVDRDQTYELSPMGRGGTVLKLPITAAEYLLIEYREPTAGDEQPPAAGVLIEHVTDTLALLPNPPRPDRRSRVNLIEADDDDALVRTELEGGNRGVAGDVFGNARTALLLGQHSRFTAIDGTALPFELTSITISAAEHKARVRITPVHP